MSKITLTDVKGGFNLTAIQSNFDALETELQGKVLYRNNPVGEPNTMETDMDMNNKRILNLPEPISDNEPLRKRDAGSLSSLIASAAGYASTASIKAAEATASASSASGSAASATASASAASASAIAAAASAVAADASADAAAASAIAAEDSSRLAVGTTTTGAPGSSVIVTITGSPGTQDLNLTIPRGDVGATGPTGPAGADGAGMTPQAIGFTVTGGTTPKTLTVALDANVSGTNTGDQTNITGNAGTVTNGVYTTDKDASGGVPGLTLFKLNLRNAANTITSWFTTAATVARTWTMPDKDGTVAMLSDITTPDLTAPGPIGSVTPSTGSFTSLTDSGNLTFTGTGNRITGDFTNATLASRVLFQTSTANNSTIVQAIPSGTGTVARWNLSNTSDPANASEASYAINATEVRFESSLRGTGSYLPITLYTSGTERLRIGTGGEVTVTSSAPLGYGVGSGGTVTQITSKSTGVTLNKPSGQVTMHNASLGAGALVAYTVTNSVCTANSIVYMAVTGGYATSPTDYDIRVVPQAGSFVVFVKNTTGGALAEAIVCKFIIIRSELT